MSSATSFAATTVPSCVTDEMPVIVTRAPTTGDTVPPLSTPSTGTTRSIGAPSPSGCTNVCIAGADVAVNVSVGAVVAYGAATSSMPGNTPAASTMLYVPSLPVYATVDT